MKIYNHALSPLSMQTFYIIFFFIFICRPIVIYTVPIATKLRSRCGQENIFPVLYKQSNIPPTKSLSDVRFYTLAFLFEKQSSLFCVLTKITTKK